MVRQWKQGTQVCVLILVVTACMFMALDASAEGRAKRIMLAGDSWPFFMWTGGMNGVYFWEGCAAQDGLDEAGYSEWDVTGGSTAIPMSMAREWRDNVKQNYQGRPTGRMDIVRDLLVSNPTIDIVHLSLGGNDIGRGNYNDVMPQQIRFTGTPTGGTFALEFEGQQTGPLPFNATASQIQSAMESLSNVGAGKIEVTGSVGGPFMCSFDPALVSYITEGPDNDIAAISSLVGGSVVVDEAHHGWQKSWGTDSAYERLFFTAICDAIEKVIKEILDVRPDIRVALCDYDYLRVDWGGASELETRHTGMRLATAKYELTQQISAMPQYSKRCFFITGAGLMQYVFGLYSRYNYNGTPATGAVLLYGPNGTAGTAGTVQRPHSNPVPVLGGDINPPVDYYAPDPPDSDHTCDISPRNVILPDIGGGDIHLNNLGYAALMKYCTEEFYGEWLDYPRVLSVRVDYGKALNPNAAKDGGDSSIFFDVTFSEPVTGVDEADFAPVMHDGLAGCRVLSVTPNTGDPSATYSVEVSRGSRHGTLTLAVIDNNSIRDESGDLLAGEVNGYFAYGEVYHTALHTVPIAGLPVGVALLAAAFAVMRRRPRA